jgi:hypothetical protein
MVNAINGMKKQSPTRCTFTEHGAIILPLCLFDEFSSAAAIDRGRAATLDIAPNPAIIAGRRFLKYSAVWPMEHRESKNNCSTI